MQRFRLNPSCVLVIIGGDITAVTVDAIVNAANERMLGGGGVDGAIHRAAGPQLLAACREVPEVSPGVRCPTGEARMTAGFNLPSNHVIHTVGPVYESSGVSAPILASAYQSCLELANKRQLQTIAFPAISCGVYGYPLVDAAKVAIQTCKIHVGGISELRFVLFGTDSYEIWLAVAESLASRIANPA